MTGLMGRHSKPLLPRRPAAPCASLSILNCSFASVVFAATDSSAMSVRSRQSGSPATNVATCANVSPVAVNWRRCVLVSRASSAGRLMFTTRTNGNWANCSGFGLNYVYINITQSTFDVSNLVLIHVQQLCQARWGTRRDFKKTDQDTASNQFVTYHSGDIIIQAVSVLIHLGIKRAACI